jgi:anti-sigma B factor antagonist
VLGDTVVLAVSGEMDIFTAPWFREAADEALVAAQRHLLLDVSRLSFLDSSILGALTELYRRCLERDVSMALVGPFDRGIAHILFGIWLGQVIGSYPTRAAALDAVGAGRPPASGWPEADA